MKRNKMMLRIIAAALAMLIMASAAIAEIDKLTISQMIQQGNRVSLYVNALDESGAPSGESLDPARLSVTTNISDNALPVTLEKNENGVAYTFCVDISGSVTNNEAKEIRESIAEFVNGMGVNDYARIITIGSEIITLCDFTSDASALFNAAEMIKNNDKKTYLYQGISHALTSTRKDMAGVPERSVIVVFTDGMDDSDGAMGDEEILSDIADVRIPIYVVGLKGKDKNASLSAVGRIARQSGGIAYSYSDYSIRDAVKMIRQVVSGATIMHVEPEYSSFGQQNIVWKAVYSSNGYTVSSANYVYSLSMENVATPTPVPTPTPTPTPTPVPHTPTPSPTPVPMPEEEPEDESISIGQWLLGLLKEYMFILIAIALVLAAVIIVLAIILTKRRSADDDDDEIEYDIEDDEPSYRGRKPVDDEEPLTVGDAVSSGGYSGGETMPPEDTEADEKTIDIYTYDGADEEATEACLVSETGITLRLEIDCEGQRETIDRMIFDHLLIGRAAECDVVLNSKSVSRRHAAIDNRPEGLVIKDLGARNKVFISGMQVMDECPLKDGDVLIMGKASVKVTIL